MFSPLQYFLLFNRHDGYGFDRAGVLACAAADTFICVNQRKTAVFFAYCSPGAFHDTEAAFDAGVFIDDGQADLCFLLFSQSQPFDCAGGAYFRAFTAIIIAKTVGVVNMNRRVIPVGFFDDLHRTVLNAEIAVQAAVGEVFRISGACGQNGFFTLAATALPKSMPLFSARTKIAATAPPVSNFRRVGLNGAAGIGAVP